MLHSSQFRSVVAGVVLAIRTFSLAAPVRGADAGSVREQVMATLAPLTPRIEVIEVYGIPVAAERRFSCAIEKNRWHVFIRFAAAGKSGWTEINLGPGQADWTLARRIAHLQWFGQLKGKTLGQAMAFLHDQHNKLGSAELEAAEVAVIDLAGRLLDRPAAEILILSETAPVLGLFCILSDDPAKVRTEAKRSLEQNLRTHLKVKLYGDPARDLAVVRAAREIMGPQAYLGGDVNMGYRMSPTGAPVDDIVAAMQALQAAGLDACEDPAQMSNIQWAEVQRRLGAFALIPDVPLRPAWQGRRTLDPTTGHLYNLHPNCMGSLIEAVELGRAIRRAGKKVMIGDASLIGPACAVWQQIAIGLGAEWVEALEKPQENDVFQRCVWRNPVTRTSDGRYVANPRHPGFGIDLDTEMLRALSSSVIDL